MAVAPAQAGKIKLTGCLVGTLLRAKKHDAALTCEADHLLVRRFVTDKDNADHVHHAGGTDRLRVDESGEEYALILDISKDVAHHIAAAGGEYFPDEVFLPAKQFGVKKRLDLTDFHGRYRLSVMYAKRVLRLPQTA